MHATYIPEGSLNPSILHRQSSSHPQEQVSHHKKGGGRWNKGRRGAKLDGKGAAFLSLFSLSISVPLFHFIFPLPHSCDNVSQCKHLPPLFHVVIICTFDCLLLFALMTVYLKFLFLPCPFHIHITMVA